MNKRDEGYNYLEELAKDLRIQRVRKGDVSNGFPLFKVIKNKKPYYFLTRKKAQDFKVENKLENDDIIEIEENENKQLENLIKTIKENF